MILEFALALLFTFGWVLVFVYRSEELGETLPALQPEERRVSYGMLIATSVNMALGCLLITNSHVGAMSALLGALVYVAGIGLWFWGRTQISPLDVRRQPNQPPTRLRRDGAFGLVRHPLYCGILLASAAPLVVTRSFFVLLTFSACVVVMLLRMAQEERQLRAQLGAEYESYQREVSRVIPFIW